MKLALSVLILCLSHLVVFLLGRRDGKRHVHRVIDMWQESNRRILKGWEDSIAAMHQKHVKQLVDLGVVDESSARDRLQ